MANPFLQSRPMTSNIVPKQHILADADDLPKPVDRKQLDAPAQKVHVEGSTFFYIQKEEVEKVGRVDNELYGRVLSHFPVCCVDVFLYHQQSRTYFLVERKDPPAKGVWWLLGGRHEKGETTFQCAERKCLQEVGIKAKAVCLLGSAETIFPDSCFGTQTHTINQMVLAMVEGNAQPNLDATCENYTWEAINAVPNDPYVQYAYNLAKAYLTHTS